MSTYMNDENKVVIVLALLLGIFVIAWLISVIRQAKAQHDAKRQERERKDTARRRYVSNRLKEYVLERDDETCQICGISKRLLDNYMDGLGDYLLLEIDHITPVASGGSGDDADNLQVLCWRCNRKKSGSKTNREVAADIDYGIRYLKKRRKLLK
ncbi:MAG: HNH endonuclease [Oscillospiraceae bacterium]|nr:HNH endonuclease [Oscillospiraceae bacterium]